MSTLRVPVRLCFVIQVSAFIFSFAFFFFIAGIENIFAIASFIFFFLLKNIVSLAFCNVPLLRLNVFMETGTEADAVVNVMPRTVFT